MSEQPPIKLESTKIAALELRDVELGQLVVDDAKLASARLHDVDPPATQGIHHGGTPW
jgi:hypothetical protein